MLSKNILDDYFHRHITGCYSNTTSFRSRIVKCRLHWKITLFTLLFGIYSTLNV